MEEHNNPNEPVQKQNLSEWEILQLIGQNVFGMDKDKISRTVQSIIDIFDFANTYSFYLVISQIIYCSIEISPNEVDKYLNFLKEFKTFEEKNQCKYKLIDILAHFLHRKKTQESFYFLETMIREGLIKEEVVKNINNLYFAHYLSEQDYKNCQYDNYFYKNIEELQKDNWKHQKELAQEGVNPNEIVKVIRTDNIEKLQEISSQTNFNFDHQIQPSIYERCSFINQNNNALIDYAAFFGAVKCFKFLLMNDIELLSTGKYAIAGGNLEIIHLCEQNHAKFEDAYETAIEFHRNDVFHYLYENKIVEINNLEELGRKCIIHHNYDIFAFLHEIGMKINESIINEASKVGNLYLIKYFLKGNPIPKDILVFSSEIGNIELVKYILEQKGIDINSKNKLGNTALMIASENGNEEMVKLLLEQKEIDINARNSWGNTALMFASSSGHANVIKLLLEHENVDINAKNRDGGSTALMFASYHGNTEAVKLLLEQKGIDINAKNNWKDTALSNAVRFDHPEIVKLLLEQEGIDINTKDNRLWTSLTVASHNGFKDIVKLLLEQKDIDINAKDDLGRTALIWAVSKGHKEIVQLLLEKDNIDVNARNGSALIIATKFGFTEIVKLLLGKEGININVKNISKQYLEFIPYFCTTCQCSRRWLYRNSKITS